MKEEKEGTGISDPSVGVRYTPNNEEWKIARFHEAMADLRWAKERGSTVSYWSLLLFAGLLALAKSLETDPTLWPIRLVALLVAVISCLWVCDLHRFQRDTRSRIKDLLPSDAAPPSREGDPDHLQYTVLHIATIIVGSALTLWAI